MITSITASRLHIGLFLALGLFVQVPAAYAVTYYVATTGSDSNPGTITQPFATFNQAISVVGNVAGATIYARGGTYYQGHTPIYFTGNGNATTHNIIEPYNNETVIIDGSQIPANESTIAIQGSYLEVNNLQIANSGFIGILCAGSKGAPSTHVWVQGNKIYNSQDAAIAVGDYTALTNTEYVFVNNNIAYNNDLVNKPRTATSWPAAVRTQEASYVSFSQNQIYQNYGEGLDLLQSNYSTATGNTVWDNYSAEVYLDNTTNATVNANLIYNTGDTRYWTLNQYNNDCGSATSCPSTSIQVANEVTKPQNYGHDRTITNNIAIGGNQNFYFGNYGKAGQNALVNDVIANNTFYAPFTGSGGANLYLDASNNYSNTLIENNIFDSDGSANTRIFATPAQLSGKVTFRTNLWFGGSNGNSRGGTGGTASAAGAGDVLTDPKFVNASNPPAGFAVQTGSPAIDAGTTLSSVQQDYTGASRPQGAAYDIGAFERAK